MPTLDSTLYAAAAVGAAERARSRSSRPFAGPARRLLAAAALAAAATGGVVMLAFEHLLGAAPPPRSAPIVPAPPEPAAQPTPDPPAAHDDVIRDRLDPPVELPPASRTVPRVRWSPS